MHIYTLFNIVLLSLASALPTGEEQEAKLELIPRWQQVGETQYNGPVGYHLHKAPVWITGGCVRLYGVCNGFYLASGFRLRAYRDGDCHDLIGGEAGQAGQSNHFFDTQNFNSYTAWAG